MAIAVIVGGGKGTRAGSRINKIFFEIAGKTILERTIDAFQNNEEIDRIIIVTGKDDIDLARQIADSKTKVVKIVEGGRKRQESVYNGIMAIENAVDDDIVVVHNAANPLVDDETIIRTVEAARKYGCSAAGIRAKDTVKEEKGGFVGKTLDRDRIWLMQTPQSMKYRAGIKAFEKAFSDGYQGTDEAAVLEHAGFRVRLVESNKENTKVTFKEDISEMSKLFSGAYIGLGMDSHRFSDKKGLVLGGVVFEEENRLEANSDGDVALHALCNAIAQAIGEGSLGGYADDMCNNGIKDSKEYVKAIMGKVTKKRLIIHNAGIMIEGKRPMIDDRAEEMKDVIAGLCRIHRGRVGITATSGEGLSEFGKGNGIQAFAVVSIIRE